MVRRLPLHAPLARWGLAVALMAASTLLNVWMQRVTQGRVPFLPYFPALIAIGYVCGAAPAVVSLVVCVVAVAALWVEPIGRLAVVNPADVSMLLLFVVGAAAAIGIA